MIAKSLRNNSTLTYLDLRDVFRDAFIDDSRESPGGIAAIAESLVGNSMLKSLFVGENHASIPDVWAMADLISSNPAIKCLNMTSMGIDDPGASRIARAIENNNNLVRLDLEGWIRVCLFKNWKETRLGMKGSLGFANR